MGAGPRISSPPSEHFASSANAKTPSVYAEGVLVWGSLAVTYFRERKLTIIGAHLFHGPVREGKGWVQKAIAAKRNLYVRRVLRRAERKMG